MTDSLQFFDRRVVWAVPRLLVVLLCTDIALIAVTVGFGIGEMAGRVQDIPALFDIGSDRSIAETLNFCKWGAIAFVYLRAWRAEGVTLHACLAAFALLILADDSLRIHERGPELLAGFLDVIAVFGRNGVIVAEVAIFSVLGLAGLVLATVGWRDAPDAARRQSLIAGLLMVPVAFCGVVLDAVHWALPSKTLLAGMLAVAEDGGEMLTISLLAAYVARSLSADPPGRQASEPRRA